MQTKKTISQKRQTVKALSNDEKIKAIPAEQQNYIIGLIDGVLMGTAKKAASKR